MFSHGYEYSMDGAIRHATYVLRGLDSLANHLLPTSSDKF